MKVCELYERRARDCAQMRDWAKTQMGRSRLERERRDWLELARRQGEDRTFRAEG
jgi:hypothetical protein